PYWRERFGDRVAHDPRFRWTMFYQALADKLLGFREVRIPMIVTGHSDDRDRCAHRGALEGLFLP
ncbi:hypothetical protein, partial [Aquisalimonas sp.]|uniref:hypothetical protein n=1 Tax=Aquisalimonas sp. TaxID=1872621 RepID=UPI0025BAB77A